MSTPTTDNAAPGWYNTGRSDRLYWWDGQNWTTATRRWDGTAWVDDAGSEAQEAMITKRPKSAAKIFLGLALGAVGVVVAVALAVVGITWLFEKPEPETATIACGKNGIGFSMTYHRQDDGSYLSKDNMATLAGGDEIADIETLRRLGKVMVDEIEAKHTSECTYVED